MKDIPPPKIIDNYGDDVKIHINTIKPFTSHGGGQYIVTSVKQMTTTKDFDNFSEDVKKCQNKESTEECSNRKLMEATMNHCGCDPTIVNQLQSLVKVMKESYSQIVD